MGSTFALLLDGFSRVMHPEMLFLCFLGSIAGTLVGVLPGLGPSAAIAVLLPMTFGTDPLSALVLLAGIFYGAMYGGTITSVLLNVPGESASVVTTFDGYPMARNGEGGVALGISAVGSFIAGTIGTLLLTLIAVPLSRMALRFGPPEFFSVMIFAFALVAGLGGGDRFKALLSLFLGLLLACIGQDVVSGVPRMTFGVDVLMDGIQFLPAVVGLFGLAEIIFELIYPSEFIVEGDGAKLKLRNVLPRLSHYKESMGAMVRGGALGFIVGVLPGAGATIASFLSYGLEKRVSKTPEKFGKGAIQGVAGPESANNGAAAGHFVPLLTLGIPASSTSAVLLGAFVLLGVQPGPRLFTEHPDVVWGLIASMYVGNVMLLVINTALIPVFVWILKISQRSLPVIVGTLCFIGVYAINSSVFDVWLMVMFAVLGFAFKKTDIPAAPLLLALVLGKDTETALRQALVISKGSAAIFFSRPISAVLLTISLLFLFAPVLMGLLKRNKVRPL